MDYLTPTPDPIPDESHTQHLAERKEQILVELNQLVEDKIVFDASFSHLNLEAFTGGKHGKHPFLNAVSQDRGMYSYAERVVL